MIEAANSALIFTSTRPIEAHHARRHRFPHNNVNATSQLLDYEGDAMAIALDDSFAKRTRRRRDSSRRRSRRIRLAAKPTIAPQMPARASTYGSAIFSGAPASVTAGESLPRETRQPRS